MTPACAGSHRSWPSSPRARRCAGSAPSTSRARPVRRSRAAPGLARLAHVAAVQDQPVVRVHPVGLRPARACSSFISTSAASCPAPGRCGCDAEDVRVHRHRRLAEGDVQHHVGGLAAHAGQGLQRLARARHLAAVLLDQDAAGLQQVLRLAAVQADGADVALQPFRPAPAWPAASATGNSRRVALLTLTSVACADSSTAASSSNTLVYSSSSAAAGWPPAGWRRRPRLVICGRRRARACAAAASITARLRSSTASGSVQGGWLPRSASLASALAARRSSFSRRLGLARRRWKRS
jgi:hypothetical protein